MTRDYWSVTRGYVDTFDPADDWPPPGPADGCASSPWCECVDCARTLPDYDLSEPF